MDNYYDELEFVRNAADNIFPDFLFTSLFNDFGDNYYSKSFVNDEMMSIVKRLRRRYSNFFDWVEAMECYNEYMDFLVEKYGSMSIVKNSIKMGTIEDSIPGKPKLKSTRKNKQFMRAGVLPSREIGDKQLTKEELLELARQAIPGRDGNNVEESDSDKKLPKYIRKQVARMQSDMEGRNRKRNLYRSVGSNSGTDFIVEYLNQTKRGVYDSSGYRTGNDDQSIADIVKEEEYIRNTRPERIEDEASDTTKIVNGRLVYRKQEELIELYKELYSEGIDILGTLGKQMDKKSVKMIRSQIGANEPMTKKELRKMKKRAKKDQERLERRRDQNSLLEKTLLGNKINLEREGNSLSFRLKDVYRD